MKEVHVEYHSHCCPTTRGWPDCNLLSSTQHQRPDAAERSECNNKRMNDTKSSPTSPTSSQDAKMIYHPQAQVQFRQEKGAPPFPQMQQFGLFSNFDGIGFVSCDGNLISDDSRSLLGHRMVLQEIENHLKPRLRLSKEDIRRREREREICVLCFV